MCTTENYARSREPRQGGESPGQPLQTAGCDAGAASRCRRGDGSGPAEDGAARKVRRGVPKRRGPGRQPEAQAGLSQCRALVGNAEKLRRRARPHSRTGPCPGHRSRHTRALLGGRRQARGGGHPPRQGEPVRAGAPGAPRAAHAPSPLHPSSPSPQSQRPSELGPSRERSTAPPATRGMRRQPDSSRGPQEDVPGASV